MDGDTMQMLRNNGENLKINNETKKPFLFLHLQLTGHHHSQYSQLSNYSKKDAKNKQRVQKEKWYQTSRKGEIF